MATVSAVSDAVLRLQFCRPGQRARFHSDFFPQTGGKSVGAWIVPRDRRISGADQAAWRTLNTHRSAGWKPGSSTFPVGIGHWEFFGHWLIASLVIRRRSTENVEERIRFLTCGRSQTFWTFCPLPLIALSLC